MTKPPKAFENDEFLLSKEARSLRILSEYLEPKKRFEYKNIEHTVVFFGSARTGEGKGRDDPAADGYWKAEEMAYKLGKLSIDLEKDGSHFSICSGGGPGIMEAANRGAKRSGIESIGLNIELPFEQDPNRFLSKDLSFEFHYFFMRKLWFLCHAKAIIVFPGGFGTLDELFETLTLIQTDKLEKPHFSILLYDEKHWREIINFEKLAEKKLISKKDLHLFKYISDIDEGIEYLTPRLIKSIKNTKQNCI